MKRALAVPVHGRDPLAPSVFEVVTKYGFITGTYTNQFRCELTVNMMRSLATELESCVRQLHGTKSQAGPPHGRRRVARDGVPPAPSRQSSRPPRVGSASTGARVNQARRHEEPSTELELWPLSEELIGPLSEEAIENVEFEGMTLEPLGPTTKRRHANHLYPADIPQMTPQFTDSRTMARPELSELVKLLEPVHVRLAANLICRAERLKVSTSGAYEGVPLFGRPLPYDFVAMQCAAAHFASANRGKVK